MARLRVLAARLEDSWLGDLIGVICLFAMLPLVLFLAEVFG